MARYPIKDKEVHNFILYTYATETQVVDSGVLDRTNKRRLHNLDT